MRKARLRRYGAATPAMNLLEGVFDDRQYGYFGCSVAGLHTDTSETNACPRCTFSPHHGSGSTAFHDDRGWPTRWPYLTRSEPWPHSRRLDGHGRIHCDTDEPALIGDDFRAWLVHGRIRRPTGGPSIVAGDFWAYTNAAGFLGRTDGPAMYWNNELHWLRDGVLTRADGAALVYLDTYADYYLDGERTSREDVWARWLEPHGVALDNVEAQQHLFDVLGVSEAVNAVYPEPDELTVRLALRLCPNG